MAWYKFNQYEGSGIYVDRINTFIVENYCLAFGQWMILYMTAWVVIACAQVEREQRASVGAILMDGLKA